MYQKESFQSKSDDTHDYYDDDENVVEITTKLVSIPYNEDFDEEDNVLWQNDQPGQWFP